MNRTRHPLSVLLLYGYALVCCAPFVWMLLTAFKSRLEATASPPTLFFTPTLENARWTYNGQAIAPLLLNSLFIASSTVALTLILGIPAAYVFARYRTTLARNLFLFVLSTRIAPPIALSLPFFVLFTKLGITGTHAAIILLHCVLNLSFVIWLLESFFSDVPEEVEMSAQVDGRTRLGAVIFVVLPLALPGIAAAGFFTFLFSWNEYMMASLMSSPLSRPITPALPAFLAQATTQWGSLCFVALVASLPVMVLAMLLRKYLAAVFTYGFVRGR